MQLLSHFPFTHTHWVWMIFVSRFQALLGRRWPRCWWSVEWKWSHSTQVCELMISDWREFCFCGTNRPLAHHIICTWEVNSIPPGQSTWNVHIIFFIWVWSADGRKGCSGVPHDVIAQMVYSDKCNRGLFPTIVRVQDGASGRGRSATYIWIWFWCFRWARSCFSGLHYELFWLQFIRFGFSKLKLKHWSSKGVLQKEKRPSERK